MELEKPATTDEGKSTGQEKPTDVPQVSDEVSASQEPEDPNAGKNGFYFEKTGVFIETMFPVLTEENLDDDDDDKSAATARVVLTAIANPTVDPWAAPLLRSSSSASGRRTASMMCTTPVAKGFKVSRGPRDGLISERVRGSGSS